MARSQSETLQIVKGPSKLDLMLAFFTRADDGGQRTVEFTLDSGQGTYEIKVIVTRIEWEDGSRESWIISGRPLYSTGEMSDRVMDSEICYNTQSRKGSWTKRVKG